MEGAKAYIYPPTSGLNWSGHRFLSFLLNYHFHSTLHYPPARDWRSTAVQKVASHYFPLIGWVAIFSFLYCYYCLFCPSFVLLPLFIGGPSLCLSYCSTSPSLNPTLNPKLVLYGQHTNHWSLGDEPSTLNQNPKPCMYSCTLAGTACELNKSPRNPKPNP